MQLCLASLWAEITKSHLCSWEQRVSVTETSWSCLSSGPSTEPTGAEVSAPEPYLAGGEWEKGKTSPQLPPVAWSTVADPLCLCGLALPLGRAVQSHTPLCRLLSRKLPWQVAGYRPTLTLFVLVPPADNPQLQRAHPSHSSPASVSPMTWLVLLSPTERTRIWNRESFLTFLQALSRHHSANINCTPLPAPTRVCINNLQRYLCWGHLPFWQENHSPFPILSCLSLILPIWGPTQGFLRLHKD